MTNNTTDTTNPCTDAANPCSVSARIPVFLSYGRPITSSETSSQQIFINRLCEYLISRGLEPRTFGVSDYSLSEPLPAIKRVMLETNGLLAIAFARDFAETYVYRKGDKDETNFTKVWFSTPYTQIETAMAFQQGLPIFMARQNLVSDDGRISGVLEKGVLDLRIPSFDVEHPDTFFNSEEFKQIINMWENQVRNYHNRKGFPSVHFNY